MIISLSGDTIVYDPLVGSPRIIKAIVDYPGAGPIGQLAGGSRLHVEILICNDPITGISSAEIDTGGDKVIVPMRRGLTAGLVRINKIITQDEASLRLLCY